MEFDESTGTSDPAEAKRVREVRMAKAILGRDPEAARRGRRPRGHGQGYDPELARELDALRARNKNKDDTYIETDLGQRHVHLRFFEGMTEIGEGDLLRFRDHMRETVSRGKNDTSTMRAITVLRRSVRLLNKKWGRTVISIVHTDDNPPMRLGEEFLDPYQAGAAIPAEQLQAWLEALPPSPWAVAVLALTTGLRWAEMRRLVPEELTVTSKYPGVQAFIRLPLGKGGRGRRMALCNAAYEALQHLWKERGEPFDYCPRTAWRTAATRTGLKAEGRRTGYVHERDMRHNFATENGEEWGDIQGLQIQMGHKTNVNLRYQHQTARRLVKFATYTAKVYGLEG